MVLPQGSQLPPVQTPLPPAAEVAWLALLPTAAPALTAAEVERVRALRSGTVDARIKTRAQAVLTANGSP
jgi:hypothetical protein